jgi:hypothetical protein
MRGAKSQLIPVHQQAFRSDGIESRREELGSIEGIAMAALVSDLQIFGKMFRDGERVCPGRVSCGRAPFCAKTFTGKLDIFAPFAISSWGRSRYYSLSIKTVAMGIVGA